MGEDLTGDPVAKVKRKEDQKENEEHIHTNIYKYQSLLLHNSLLGCLGVVIWAKLFKLNPTWYSYVAAALHQFIFPTAATTAAGHMDNFLRIFRQFLLHQVKRIL